MFNKITIQLFFIFGLSLFGSAQPLFEWVNSGGTGNLDGGVEVAFDEFGYNYSLVSNYGSPSTTVQLTLYKRSSTGVLQWTKNINNGIKVNGQALTVDDLGNVYIGGSFEGTADFNPGPGVNNLVSNGDDDNFILKLDTNGDFIWAKSFGGSGGEELRSIKIDNNGNVVSVGRYSLTVDFDPGAGTNYITSNGSYDIFISKLDSNGDFIWAKSVGGNGFDTGNALTIDSNGDIITSGGFYGFVDFDPGVGANTLISSGGFDIFILKLDMNGNHIWSKSIGSGSTDIVFGIASSGANDIYLTGNFSSTVDFDPNSGVSNLISLGTPYDCFVLKLNTLGEFEWAHNFGGTGGFGSGVSIAVDGIENIYIAGEFRGNVDFDPDPIDSYELSVVDQDHFLLKLDNAGNFYWVINSTPTSSVASSASSVALDDNFNILMSGGFVGTRDFDFSTGTSELTSIGDYDHFTMFLSSECISSIVTPDQVSLSDITSECSVSSLTPPTATTSCGISIDGVFDVTLPITIQGTTTITWTYDDGNGNTTTQAQDVVINDVTAPIADNNILITITDECSITTLTSPTATDNCNGLITGTHNLTLPITSSTTITWTYDDGNGNTTTQAQDVVINDVTAPIADNNTLTTITDECSITTLTSPTATDNCNGLITGTHNLTLPITSSTTITWTYDDGNGNTTTQTQDVVITPVGNGVTQIDAITLVADASGYNYQWVDCDNTNAPIPGETSQTFVASENGNYAVEVSNGTCSIISNCNKIDEVGIDEIETSLFKVYPNPTEDNITIQSDKQIESINVLNAIGKVVVIVDGVGFQKMEVSLPKEKGVYFIKVNTNENSQLIKVVKK